MIREWPCRVLMLHLLRYWGEGDWEIGMYRQEKVDSDMYAPSRARWSLSKVVKYLRDG